MKRLLAGLITALLLLAPSLAAACDISCSFPQNSSDCHGEQAPAQASGLADMAMNGMAMPDMAEGNAGNRPTVSGASHAAASHPLVGTMGQCERKSCAPEPGVSAKTTRSAELQFPAAFVAIKTTSENHNLLTSLCGSPHDTVAVRADHRGLLSIRLRV